MTKRILLYLVIWFAVTWAMADYAITSSMVNMANDPSSMAWAGFLPFLLPFFFAEAGMFVVPTAITIELIAYVIARKRAKIEKQNLRSF